jgi:hypothetical protein
MGVYLCRWPNGDVSLVSGKNRLEIDSVLDEVGNPDATELIPIRHAVAVHFRLKEKIDSDDGVASCLKLEGFDERLASEFYRAYPILDEVLSKEDATPEEIAAAVEKERNRMEEEEPPDLSADPNIAKVQCMTDLPKSLAEHHVKTAKAIASRQNRPAQTKAPN